MTYRRVALLVSAVLGSSVAVGLAGCGDDTSGSTPSITLPDGGVTITPAPTGDAAAPDDAGAIVVLPQSACAVALDATMTASISLTADNRRKLWVNGALIAATEDDWGTDSTYPITLFRHPSKKNVIAIEGINQSSQPGADRGIMADLSWANADDGGMVHVVTDASWRLSMTETASWYDNAFDDAAYTAAFVQGQNGMSPWGARAAYDANAGWIWTYDSATAAAPKVDMEHVYARRSFYLDLHAQPSSTPVACP